MVLTQGLSWKTYGIAWSNHSSTRQDFLRRLQNDGNGVPCMIHMCPCLRWAQPVETYVISENIRGNLLAPRLFQKDNKMNGNRPSDIKN